MLYWMWLNSKHIFSFDSKEQDVIFYFAKRLSSMNLKTFSCTEKLETSNMRSLSMMLRTYTMFSHVSMQQVWSMVKHFNCFTVPTNRTTSFASSSKIQDPDTSIANFVCNDTPWMYASGMHLMLVGAKLDWTSFWT